MFSNLSVGALGLDIDFPSAIELAQEHGFGGIDPDAGHLAALHAAGGARAVADLADEVRGRGLSWGIAGLPLALDASAEEFRADLAALPSALEPLVAAGVTRVGTWVRPMHDELDHRQNWRLHLGRVALVGQLLADAGMRLGLEYIGPKTFWSTERFPFIHSLREMRELIAESGCGNVGLILDSFHWYTAGESADDLEGLTDADIVSVDVNDAPQGLERDEQKDLERRLPWDTGVIDLEGFTSALHAAGCSGPVKAEPFLSDHGGASTAEVLADVSDRLERVIAPR